MTITAVEVIPLCVAAGVVARNLLSRAIVAVERWWNGDPPAMRVVHQHVCTDCGRIQFFVESFPPDSLCRACQLAIPHKPFELDLDAFADAQAIRVYLDGVEFVGRDVPAPSAACDETLLEGHHSAAGN